MIVDCDELHVVALRARLNRRSESHIGRADHEALGTLRAEVVDCGQHFFAVRRADIDHREAVLLPERGGGFLFVDEPGLFRHLHEEADFERLIRVRGELSGKGCGERRGGNCG